MLKLLMASTIYVMKSLTLHKVLLQIRSDQTSLLFHLCISLNFLGSYIGVVILKIFNYFFLYVLVSILENLRDFETYIPRFPDYMLQFLIQMNILVKSAEEFVIV